MEKLLRGGLAFPEKERLELFENVGGEDLFCGGRKKRSLERRRAFLRKFCAFLLKENGGASRRSGCALLRNLGDEFFAGGMVDQGGRGIPHIEIEDGILLKIGVAQIEVPVVLILLEFPTLVFGEFQERPLALFEKLFYEIFHSLRGDLFFIFLQQRG